MHDRIGCTRSQKLNNTAAEIVKLIEGFQATPSPVLPLDDSSPDVFLFLHTGKGLSTAALYSPLFFLVGQESGFNLTFRNQGLIVFLGKTRAFIAQSGK